MMAGKCMSLMRYFISNRVVNISARHISMTSTFCYEKRPRVLPVTHQVAGDHNSQFFTSYPYLSKEEMEEPPSKVDDVVKDVLERSRPKSFGYNYKEPENFLCPKEFKKIKKELIEAGHYFPDEPEEDLYLQVMPKVQRRILKTEARLKRIEENMKMMPQWIAEYKERYRQVLLKEKEDALKNRGGEMEMKRFGLHPKDPRAKQLLAHAKLNQTQEREKIKVKKKYGKKKKKEDKE